MEEASIWRKARMSSYDPRVMTVVFGLVAVISTLYIDQNKPTDEELDEEGINFSSYLPLLLLILIMAITISRLWDQCLIRFDPNWIHRFGGSSTGIMIILMILALVLKCKAVSI